MAALLTARIRKGPVPAAARAAAGQTAVEVHVIPDPQDLALRGQVGMAVVVEQTPDNGVTWYTLGECSTPDVAATLAVAKPGQPPRTAVTMTLTEQIYRADKAAALGFATARDLTFQGTQYKQLALLPDLRVTVDTYTVDAEGKRAGDADLLYAVDLIIDARPRTDLPAGMIEV